MNASEFVRATIGRYSYPDGRTVAYRLLNTEHVLQMALFPLMFFDQRLGDSPSPEEELRLFEELIDTAKQIIINQCYEPKFVRGKDTKPDELSIDFLFPGVIEDDDYGRDALGLYRDILNKSGTMIKRNHSLAELRGREALILACEAFHVDPTEAVGWGTERSATLLDCHYILIDAKIRAKEERDNK